MRIAMIMKVMTARTTSRTSVTVAGPSPLFTRSRNEIVVVVASSAITCLSVQKCSQFDTPSFPEEDQPSGSRGSESGLVACGGAIDFALQNMAFARPSAASRSKVTATTKTIIPVTGSNPMNGFVN